MAKRRKRTSTVDERIAAIGRMIRATGEAVGHDDPTSLAAFAELSNVLHDAIAAAVVELRVDHTWRSIATALGVTPQACVIRYGDAARDAGNVGPLRGNVD